MVQPLSSSASVYTTKIQVHAWHWELELLTVFFFFQIFCSHPLAESHQLHDNNQSVTVRLNTFPLRYVLRGLENPVWCAWILDLPVDQINGVKEMALSILVNLPIPTHRLAHLALARGRLALVFSETREETHAACVMSKSIWTLVKALIAYMSSQTSRIV